MPKTYKKRRTYKRKSTYKRKTVSSMMSKQLLRMSEPKFFPVDEIVDMKHNTYFQFSPTQAITPGNTASTRVGDSIYLQSLHLSGFYESSAIANASNKFRCMVFWSPVALPAPNITSNIVTGTQLFFPGTDFLVPNAVVNPKAITLLSDFVIDMNQQLSTAKDLKSFNVTIPINQTFNYGVAGGPYGKFKNLYVTFVAITPGGTNGTTQVGFTNYSSVLRYKDP